MRGAGNAPTALPRLAAAGWLRPPTSDRTPADAATLAGRPALACRQHRGRGSHLRA